MTARTALFAWCLWLPAAFFLPLSVVQGATPPAQATDYQLKGWNLQVSLDPEKTSFVQGEPIYVALTIRNNSNEDLAVIVGGDTWNWLYRPEKFQVQVVRGNGSALPLRQLPPGQPGGSFFVGPQKIPAKGSYAFSLLLSDWAELKEPGNYAVTASRTLDLQKYSRSDMSWRDPANLDHLEVCASGIIALRPYDRKALGAVIDARGRAMLGSNEDAAETAARALALIDDDRAVAYFTKVVGESTGYSGMLFTAIDALGRFNNDAALAALVQASQAAANNTRHVAAVALSKSPHPRAIDVLLKMRSDPYMGVRNTVLQAVANMQTTESLQMIREMTNDADEIIRVEALRYLKLRTEVSSPSR